MTRVIPLLLCTFFVGAIIGTGTAKQADVAYALEQPEHWVPFSAHVVHVSAAGRVSRGRFYRGTDGSTRHDMTLVDCNS